jgi:hypothetical protein
MPLPSQIASGKTTFRDYLIDFTPIQRDFDYYDTWLQAQAVPDIMHLRDCVDANWKVSITPSGNPEMPYLSLTCKKPGAYLQGFTLSPKGVGLEHLFSFSAWLIFSIAPLLGYEVDEFLTHSGGWAENEAGNGENSRTDDEIPF